MWLETQINRAKKNQRKALTSGQFWVLIRTGSKYCAGFADKRSYLDKGNPK